MKRVVVAIITFAAILGLSAYSLLRIEHVHKDLTAYVGAAEAALRQDDEEALSAAVETLCGYWKETEHSLIHIVRHAQIDEITKSVSKLPALTEYRSDALLLSELHSIVWQMEHIRDSEQPTLGNVL